MGAPEFCPLQVNGNRRSSQPAPYYDSSINIINALEGYSLWQVLMQMMMNSIQEFDGLDREATILWLDHIESWIVNLIGKEGNLLYFQTFQLLIEHYSNVPYMSDALNVYAHLMQGKNKTVTQYLARAKVRLEHIHHTSKLCGIPGRAITNFTLSKNCSPHVQGWVASKQDTWKSMKDVFQMINHVTRSKEWTRAFFKPNFKTAQPVIQVNEVSYGKATRHNMLDWSYNSQPHQVWFSNNFSDTNRHPRGSLKKDQGQHHYKHSPRKPTCYYC